MNVTETNTEYPVAVYQLDQLDPVEGGPDGVDNLPHKQLANRTAWLKLRLEQIQLTPGPKGDKGDTGAASVVAGPKGDQGIQGIQGAKGDQGVKGDQGAKGDQGLQGLQGDQGAKGDQGLQGATGPQQILAAGLPWADSSSGSWRLTIVAGVLTQTRVS